MSKNIYTNLALIGVVGAGIYTFLPIGKRPDALFQTTATKSIADRFSSAGGTHTHTPGVATERGNAANTIESQHRPSGVGTPHFDENMANQSPGGRGTHTKNV